MGTFDMIFLSMFISIQNLLLEEKNNQLFTGFHLVEKMEDSKVMEYSYFIQVQVKYLSPAAYIWDSLIMHIKAISPVYFA